MEKLHKRNLIIVWCSVVALSLVSLMGYGFTVLAIRGIAILVVAGIISTIGCYLSIDDANFLFHGVGYHLFRSAVYGYFGRIYDFQS